MSRSDPAVVPRRWSYRSMPGNPSSPALGWAAILLALVFAASVLHDGYYDFGVWGALSLAAMALLACLAWVSRPAVTRSGLVAIAGLTILVVLSFASMAWAESKESAWTDANRLAFYVVTFGIVVLAVRERRTARATMLILGSAALVTSLWLCASIVFSGGGNAFLTRRLNAPIGYINGTAGLLLMGLWPWLACAETAKRFRWRAASLGVATLIASTMVLAQSRAVVPAIAVSAVAVLLCASGRTVRALNLLLIALGVAATLPWTLRVYSSGGVVARGLAPDHGVLLDAAVAMVASALVVATLRAAISLAAGRLTEERRRRARTQIGRMLAVGTLAILAVGAPIAAPWIARQYRVFTSLQPNAAASVRFVDAGGYRYDLWRVALREFLDHPLNGVGAGSYDAQYYLLRQNPQYVVQPHSIELQMAAELGVGGVVALLLFIGGILWAAARRDGTLASGDRMVKVAATGMFVAWLVHTSMDWLYDIPGLTGMAMVSAALLVLPARRQRADVVRTRRGMAVVIAGLIVLAALAGSVGRQYVAQQYQSSGEAQVARAPHKAIANLQRARSLDPYSLTTLYSLAAGYARLDEYSRAQRTLLTAAALEPRNHVPPALLGDLARRRGDLAGARADYARALALNPRDPTLQAAVNGVGHGATP